MNKVLFSFLAAAIVFIAVPTPTFAHEIKFFADGGYWGGDTDPVLSCRGSTKIINEAGELVPNEKPCNVCEMMHTAQHIAYFILTLLIFVVVPILIMWGGALIIFSQGSSERLGEGKKVISGAFIGIALGLGAYILVNTFMVALGQLSSASTAEWGKFDCTKIPAFLKPAGE